jgi:hypothetical protein
MYGEVCGMKVALPFSDGVPGRASGAAAAGMSLGFVSNFKSQNAPSMSGSTGYIPDGDELSMPLTMGFIRDRSSP